MSIRTEPENRTRRREITRFPGEVHLPEIPESQNKYAEKIGQTSRFSAEVKCAGWSEELIDWLICSTSSHTHTTGRYDGTVLLS